MAKTPAPMTEGRGAVRPDRSTAPTAEDADRPASGARTAEEADAARNKRDSSGDQKKENKVSVVALRTFSRDGNPISEDRVTPGETFECERGRAAELRSNGLVKYSSEKMDAEIHGEVDAKRIQESVEQSDKLRAIPKTAMGTPLRNPEIKLADIKDDDSKK